MLARFMRFFRMSDAEIMAMPIDRFLSLYRRIAILEAEEEIKALAVHHHGKPGERIEQLAKFIETGGAAQVVDKPIEWHIGQPGDAAIFEETAGSIAQERERQIQAAERLKKEQEAWRAQHKQRTQPQP